MERLKNYEDDRMKKRKSEAKLKNEHVQKVINYVFKWMFFFGGGQDEETRNMNIPS